MFKSNTEQLLLDQELYQMARKWKAANLKEEENFFSRIFNNKKVRNKRLELDQPDIAGVEVELSADNEQ